MALQRRRFLQLGGAAAAMAAAGDPALPAASARPRTRYLTQLQRAIDEGVGIRQPLRAGARRLQDSEADAQEERVLVPGGGKAQYDGLAFTF